MQEKPSERPSTRFYCRANPVVANGDAVKLHQKRNSTFISSQKLNRKKHVALKKTRLRFVAILSAQTHWNVAHPENVAHHVVCANAGGHNNNNNNNEDTGRKRAPRATAVLASGQSIGGCERAGGVAGGSQLIGRGVT